MSEIEKMYSNAGIKVDRIVCYRGFDNCIDNDFNCHCHNKKPCKDAVKIYPPFTAEKQIELIKLLSYYYNITISKNFENHYTFQCEGDDVRRYVFTSGQDFAEQLAAFVNMCYELLPEEEKQQVKGILE